MPAMLDAAFYYILSEPLLELTLLGRKFSTFTCTWDNFALPSLNCPPPGRATLPISDWIGRTL